MKSYRRNSFFGIMGDIHSIELSDYVYGEWIVYEDGVAKYHVDAFDENFNSNVTIKSLLADKRETIESIVHKINIKQGTKLSLGNEPLIKIVKKSEIVNLELGPLPELWVKNID